MPLINQKMLCVVHTEYSVDIYKKKAKTYNMHT